MRLSNSVGYIPKIIELLQAAGCLNSLGSIQVWGACPLENVFVLLWMQEWYHCIEMRTVILPMFPKNAWSREAS